MISVTGTITFIELEGGFYGLITEDGQQYFPLNLEECYPQDGLSVHFQAKLKRGTATTQMRGTPIEILSITPLSAPAENPKTMVNTTGTVRFADLEGRFYGIVTDRGEHYNPLHLDDRFQVGGLTASFEGEIIRYMISTQRGGTPLEITEMAQAD